MINLEFYKDEIIKSSKKNTCFWGALLEVRNGAINCNKTCAECLEEGMGWLLEEYKEPIKLKQWEYDLLFIYSYDSTAKFEDSSVLSKMKEEGHFKGITDTSVALEEIVNNCERVE